MNSKILLICTLLFTLGLSSCFKGDYDDPPAYSDANLTVNKSILDLKTWFAENNASQNPKTVSEDWTIKGVVTSSDRAGNIYKQIFIQDETAGLCISIDAVNTYTDYPVGRYVYITLKGLTLGTYGGLVQVGYGIDAQYSPAGVFRIPTTIVSDHIYKGAMMDTPPSPIQITDFAQLTDSLQSMLVSLENVELPDNEMGETYADAVAQVSKNRTLRNCNNQSIILRNSGYSSFAGIKMPRGNGNAEGIFTVYNRDLQFLISDTSGLSGLRNFRCDGTDPNANYVLEENFENSTTNTSINGVNGWETVMESGNKDWVGGSYGGTRFAKMSAYNSGAASMLTWLISPSIDLSAYSTATLTFLTLEGYDNGAQLKVYYSTDYTGDGAPQNATWIELNANIAAGTSSGYASQWTPSGEVDLSAISAPVYLAWKYIGSDTGGKTTTFEVDNVKVLAQ